jgi:hypothetical protein
MGESITRCDELDSYDSRQCKDSCVNHDCCRRTRLYFTFAVSDFKICGHCYSTSSSATIMSISGCVVRVFLVLNQSFLILVSLSSLISRVVMSRRWASLSENFIIQCREKSLLVSDMGCVDLPVDSSSYMGNTMRYAGLHLHHVFPVCLITLSIGISLPLLNGYTFSHLVFTCLFTPRCYRQLACPLLPLLSGLPFCDKVKAYLCFCSIAAARIKKPHQSSSSFSHTNSSYPLSISLWSSTPVASPILWRQHHRTPPGSTSCYCLEPRGSSLAIVVAATLSYASSRNSSSLRLNKQSPIAPSTAPSRSLPSFCILNLDRVQPLLPYLTSLHLARHV